MASYIGANDRETLLGVLELLDRRLAWIGVTRPTLKRDQYARTRTLAVLTGLRYEIADASERGPTPTPEALATLRITVPPESRARLARDRLSAEDRAALADCHARGAHDEQPGTACPDCLAARSTP